MDNVTSPQPPQALCAAELVGLLKESLSALKDYAAHNPRWTDERNQVQDPSGVHGLLEKIEVVVAAKHFPAVTQDTSRAGGYNVLLSKLESDLKSIRQSATDNSSENPPKGYYDLTTEQIAVADQCWHNGMDAVIIALQNWIYDQRKKSPEPVAPSCDSSRVEALANALATWPADFSEHEKIKTEAADLLRALSAENARLKNPEWCYMNLPEHNHFVKGKVACRVRETEELHAMDMGAVMTENTDLRSALTAAESENARLREDSAQLDFIYANGVAFWLVPPKSSTDDTGDKQKRVQLYNRAITDSCMRAARATPPASGESLNK